MRSPRPVALVCTAALVAIAGCGPRVISPHDVPPPEHVYDNHSEASFVAMGTVEAVLDAIAADLASQECLDVRRGRDSTGTAALSMVDPCPGQSNRAVLRVVDAGDGTVSGRTETVYSGASTRRPLATLPVAALVRQRVPVAVVPVATAGGPACTSIEAWRADPQLPAPPDTTVRVVETPPEIVGGLVGFSRSVHYPNTARRDGAQGITVARFEVDAGGRVTCAELTSSLRADLDAEALRAVRATRFTPATRDGQPVAMRMALPIHFIIR